MTKLTQQIGNQQIRVTASEFGARLVAVDLNVSGRWVPVCVGFENIETYQVPDVQYFGATIGRVAGRLPGGVYALDGFALKLEQNEDSNHLHGGIDGAIHNRSWELKSQSSEELVYELLCKDGEGGFPGNLRINVTYRVSGGDLEMLLQAQTDKSTPVNLTNHAYWNLSGNSAPAREHQLVIYADHVIPVDAALIATGKAMPVAGTGFDFTKIRSIGELGTESTEPAPGFDHTFLLREGTGIRTAAILRHPNSGISMEVLTDSDALQFYAGNRNPNMPALSGQQIQPGNTICLEAFGVNSPEVVGDYKTITLHPEKKFSLSVIHRFSS